MTVAAAALAVLVLVRAVDLLRRNERLRRLAQASEERFRVLVGDVDAIVWEADAETLEFQFVSRHAEALLGYPVEAWTQDPEFWASRLHPDDRAWVRAYCASAVARRADHELEYRMLAADGRVVWLRESARVVRVDGGRERLRGVMVDVTARRQMETDLERERSLLRATLESTGDGIVVVDSARRISAFNRRFVDMWRLPAAVAEGTDAGRAFALALRQLTHPSELAASVAQLQLDPTGESSDVVELADGRVFQVDSKPQLLGGELAGRVWSFRDVTERAAAERTIRESARRFQEALENVPLAAVAIDLRSQIAFVNDFLLELTGWSREELLGRRWRDVFTPQDEDGLRISDAWEQGLTAGRPPRTQEARLVTRDGRIRLISWANTPLHGADGVVNGVACVGADITERRLADEALRRSEERFRALTENALEVVGVISPDGAILYQSPSVERLLGYTPDEVVGRNASELVHPDDLDANRAQLVELLEEPGSMREYELRGLHKDGSHRRISGFARNLVDNPAVGGIVVNFRDVTELRQSQEQLLHAQKLEAVGQLAGGVAHDFNNLLTAIRGYAELMLMQLPAGDPLRGDAEEIARAGERAAALTRQLLAFSRRQLLQTTVLEVNAVVSEIENLLRRLIGEDVELVTVLDPACCRVKADPGQLEQVLVNLAVNARDAMPEGGRLTIETGYSWLAEGEHGLHAGAYAVLSVADTGSGMTEETLSHLFEPFFTTKERGKGTGLGLATVYGIVKQSGGEVVVESEPGRGSRFTVYLPRVAEPAALNGDGSGRPADDAGSETVLLVEDEALVRALARRVLEQQGYTVLEAAEAPAALELCSRHAGPIDLLLTDVVMPKMSGCELAQQLASLRPGTRVLYTSGYNEEAIGQHGVTDLGGAFLSKPFTPSTLARKVREVLDT